MEATILGTMESSYAKEWSVAVGGKRLLFVQEDNCRYDNDIWLTAPDGTISIIIGEWSVPFDDEVSALYVEALSLTDEEHDAVCRVMRDAVGADSWGPR